MPSGRPPVDERKRFLEKVFVVESGCHEWQAGLNRLGYGKVYFRKKCSFPAHRAAHILFKGEIPDGRWVLHKCDNRKCVNPEHLFLGDAVANIRDMDTKKRRGTKCPFTKEQAEEIIRLLGEGYSQRSIADRLQVHQTAISRIKLGHTKLFKEN
jgi:hypothetical protein